ncbi:MAG TPA: serine/threonine-protein kinase, partial [Verrucomicrobiae bacterium]|nr:serine/threonine-protein kinase [Verrucomicrobiae bacterium]
MCALRTALEAGSTPEGFDFAGEPSIKGHGDYDLLEEIGRGGMGVVFRARQKSLNRFVALKVLYGGVFASPAGRKQLLSEAAAAARLRHPNIVAVHQTGELDGQPFYSMDFIAGRTLAEVARSGPVSPHRAAGWLQKIATAVHYAHSQNVLHRDLKPSNVLLTEADEPRITDFGLAKVLD